MFRLLFSMVVSNIRRLTIWPRSHPTHSTAVKSPTAPVAAIIAAIKVAIALAAKINIKVAFVQVDISLCVTLLVQIILVRR